MGETIATNPGAHVAVEISLSGLQDLGFDAADLMRTLSSVLPRLAVLERDGRLREIEAGAVVAEAARSELGYVDLVCAAR
jgi:pyruvoyl-dependent arginine decarboxylase (PvlArgDC)